MKLINFFILIFSATPFLCFSSEGFTLELIANAEYQVGPPVVVNIRITNQSGSDAVLVYGQDGSLHKFRYPYLYFSVLTADSSEVKIIQPIDKVVNPLSSQAFFTLKSGAETDFFEDGFDLSRFYSLPEGNYTAICSYSTDAEKESLWYGAYADDYWEGKYENSFWLKKKQDIERCAELLKQVPKLNIISKPVMISVKKDIYISTEKALSIAEEVCRTEKWKWDPEKVFVSDQGNEWVINTNKYSLGMNGIIHIDKRTGQVISKFMTGP